MKKLLFLSLFLLCCSNTFNYKDISVYNLSFAIKDPYTLSSLGDKTTIRHKDTVISVIKLDKDPQTSGAYANAIATRLVEQDAKLSIIEQKINKNKVKYTYFTSSDGEIDTMNMVIKQPNDSGYVLACNKKEFNTDNICEILLDSVKVK